MTSGAPARAVASISSSLSLTRNTATTPYGAGSHLHAALDATLAHLPTPRSPKSGPIFCTLCHRLRNACHCRRCAVTGAPIEPSAYIMRIREPLKRLPPRYLEEQSYIGPPATLHVHPFHGGTERVGLAFSGLMMRYLTAVMRELDLRTWHELSDWWESEYGIERVRRGLGEMYTSEKAERIFTWVLQCAREETTPANIARKHHQTLNWIAKTVARCQWLADRSYGSPVWRMRG